MDLGIIYQPFSYTRRESEFSYVNTKEMLADMFTKPVLPEYLGQALVGPGNKLQIYLSDG